MKILRLILVAGLLASPFSFLNAGQKKDHAKNPEIQKINQAQKAEVQSIRKKYQAQIDKTNDKNEAFRLMKERKAAVTAAKAKYKTQRQAARRK